MRVGIIKEFGDERVVVEELLHNAALDALPSSVDKAHLSQPSGVRSVNVVTKDRRDVFRNKSVEIETAVDGDGDWLFVFHGYVLAEGCS
jgi:hypothetical protein